MKFKDIPGDFGFKALISFPKHHPEEWNLSGQYFFSLEEAVKAAGGATVKWPVEVYEDGSVRVVSPEEINEEI